MGLASHGCRTWTEVSQRDHIFISHYHSKEDGFANIEEASEWIEDDRASVSSVIHRSTAQHTSNSVPPHVLTQQEIRHLAEEIDKISITAEIKAYQHNIITFLRLHRAVGSGVSPRATQHLSTLVKYVVTMRAYSSYADVSRCIAVIHGHTYISPSFVALAIPKVYTHRIIITKPEAERSLQYGSQLSAVSAIIEGYTPGQVIDEVLQSVEVPV